MISSGSIILLVAYEVQLLPLTYLLTSLSSCISKISKQISIIFIHCSLISHFIRLVISWDLLVQVHIYVCKPIIYHLKLIWTCLSLVLLLSLVIRWLSLLECILRVIYLLSLWLRTFESRIFSLIWFIEDFLQFILINLKVLSVIIIWF